MGMNRRFRVLAVDDESEALKLLEIVLGAEGFEVITAQDAVAGLRAAYQTQPDAILLDVMMPNVNGFEVCRRLRELTDAPIIFITAKGTIEDVVQGFTVGADDYITKPFDGSELVSRLMASLRRASERSNKGSEVLFPSDSVMLDCGRHELVVGDKTVHLTPKEFEVLRLMLRHPGKVLSTDAILARVWGAEQIGELHLVKQYIYRLRQKIEPDPTQPQFLHTVRGGGYYFDAKESD
jgi:DNA-binding response OmpR family regulator